MMILVAGGRHYGRRSVIIPALEFMVARQHPCHIIHGGCKSGVDSVVAHWCYQESGVQTIVVPALWAAKGKAAGPERNKVMVAILKAWKAVGGGAEALIFPGGRGTEHVTEILRRAGLPIWLGEEIARNGEAVPEDRAR